MSEKSPALTFSATIYRDGEPRTATINGRPAWLLLRLMQAGGRGVTTLDLIAARRVSHYLFMLRKSGINVETTREQHGGAFAGNHGRFRLMDRVSVSGGTLAEWLASPEGRREFPDGVAGDARQAA